VPSDPVEHQRVGDAGPAAIHGREPPDLRRMTRRALLRVYSPQQAAIWLGAHASGDPLEVAHKARRLCGIDRPPGASMSSPRRGASAQVVVPTAELAAVRRNLGDARQVPRLLHRIIDNARSAMPSATLVALTFFRDLAPEPLQIDHDAALDDAVATALAGGPGREVLAGHLVATPDLDADHRWPAAARFGAGPGAVRSLMLAPIVDDRQVIGSLHVRAEAPHAFDAQDRVITAILAAHAGMAIRASRTDVEPTVTTVDHELYRRVEEQLMTRHGAADTDLPRAVRMASRQLVASTQATRAPDHRIGADSEHGLGPGSASHVHELLLSAVRDIYNAEQPEEVQAVLLEIVTKLGGSITRAAEADERSVPIDLALNIGDPLLATPPTDPPEASEHLHAHLPRLVEDARQAIQRLERHGRLAADAEQDALTGLFNRRAYERFTGRLRAGDVLMLLDLDDFKLVNDTHGHLVGDQVLRVFGSVLRDHMRITEHAIRLGGDEFLVLLEEPSADGPNLLLERLSVAWRQRRPVPVSFSCGIATVTSGVDAALELADRSLYDQKHARALAERARRGRRCK
jgi:diguanylate cyclase (GGDEF)-like protein